MKQIILLLSLFGAGKIFAMNPIVNDSSHEVYFTFIPTLEVTLMEYEMGKGILTLSFGYNSDHVKAEEAKVAALYPDYHVGSLPVRALKDFQLLIPSLKVDQLITPSPGISGPYFEQLLTLDAAQLKSLRSSLAANPLEKTFQVIAPVAVNYVGAEILEEVTVPGSVCKNLLISSTSNSASANSLKLLVQNLMDYRPDMKLNLVHTLKNLRENILKQCFDLEPTPFISNFSELLNLKLKTKSVSSVKGQTFTLKNKTETYNETYLVDLKGPQ